MLHDSIRVCPDSSRYNMCELATAIHHGAQDESRFISTQKSHHPQGGAGDFSGGSAGASPDLVDSSKCPIF
jgi:hypothetical protein